MTRELLFLAALAIAAVDSPAAAPGGTARSPVDVPIVWQHHETSFSYVGITTLYNCDALESQVARILDYLGARADRKVRASCIQPELPTRQAVVRAEFDTPMGADPTAAGTVAGRWTTVGLEAGHPHFVEAGDCELIQAMKDLLTRNFSWRELDYTASCFPHDISLHDFEIKGQVLKAHAPAPG